MDKNTHEEKKSIFEKFYSTDFNAKPIVCEIINGMSQMLFGLIEDNKEQLEELGLKDLINKIKVDEKEEEQPKEDKSLKDNILDSVGIKVYQTFRIAIYDTSTCNYVVLRDLYTLDTDLNLHYYNSALQAADNVSAAATRWHKSRYTLLDVITEKIRIINYN